MSWRNASKASHAGESAGASAKRSSTKTWVRVATCRILTGVPFPRAAQVLLATSFNALCLEPRLLS
jgi:hypothetical protein